VTADDIKAVVCCYWRFVRQCPLVATETTVGGYGFSTEFPPDVMAVSKNGFLIETEVKVSIADLRREITKQKYRVTWGLDGLSPRYQFPAKYSAAKFFYFAVPSAIVERAKPVLRELYPGAGLLEVEDLNPAQYKSVIRWLPVAIRPRAMPSARRLSVEATHALTLRIVNQMCSAMLDAANARRDGEGSVADLADMILAVGSEQDTEMARPSAEKGEK